MVYVGQIAVSIVNNSLNFSCHSLSIKLAAVLKLFRSNIQAVRSLQVLNVRRQCIDKAALLQGKI
jgi:hypothetical protein